jgi:hypothetical protein
MPYTLNGIGTKYYGQRAIRQDGSFVTTEWFVLLYVPIFPLGSYRVRPTGERQNFLLYVSTKYFVERIPLCWPQIRNAYAVSGTIFGLLMLALFGSIQPVFEETSKSPSQRLSYPQTSLY